MSVNHYKKITFWQNKYRTEVLYDFRENLIKYFDNSSENFMGDRSENENAKIIRFEINQSLQKIHRIISASGISVDYVYTPPPAVGGYRQTIDLLHNIFNISSVHIDPRSIFDQIERSIGIYENDYKNSIIRTFNPFFWLFLILEKIISIPFLILGKAGFNRTRIETSIFGKFFKALMYLATIISSILTILHLMNWLEPVRRYFNFM